MVPMKRVYYFTPPEFALENLQQKSLKVSRFSQCNDPFELASFSQKNKEIRQKFRNWLTYMDELNGLLCFCRSWRNPVMWAHYAKNHTGICYGFDVDPYTFIDVRYVSERLYPDLSPSNFLEHVGEDQMVDLFATKFIHWSYEEEVRLLVTFSRSVLHEEKVFHSFSDSMKLKEVIVGPNSSIKASDIATNVSDRSVEIFKSRLAFQRFEVVRQKSRQLW